MVASLTAIAAAIAGTAVAAPSPLCVVPGTVHVPLHAECGSFGSLAADHADIMAVRGEAEHVHVVFTPGAAGAARVSVSALGAPGGASIPAAAVEVFQVGYVNTTETTRYSPSGGGWRPDPLFPLGTGGLAVTAGSAQALWVRLSVPSSATPGMYTGTLTISVPGATSMEVPLRVEVVAVTLPAVDKSSFGTVFSFDPAGLTPFYAGADGAVPWGTTTKWLDAALARRMPGTMLYASTPPTEQVVSYLAGQGARYISLLSAGDCDKYDNATVDAALDKVSSLVQQAQRQGILDRCFIYGFDERPASCEPAVRAYFGEAKRRWPGLRTMAVLNWENMPEDLPLDVWVVQYEYDRPNSTTAATAAKWQAAGHQLWLYHCIEPSGSKYLNTFIEHNLIEARLLYWYAALLGADGWLYYAVDLWRAHPGTQHKHDCVTSRVWAVAFAGMLNSKPSVQVINRIGGTSLTDFSPANYIWTPRTDIFANGDGQFYYPGPGGEPITTPRLDVQGDGIEDAELLLRLSPAQRKPLLQQLVRGPTDWTNDPALLEKVRRQALQALVTVGDH
eukprot:gene3013-3573_t